MSDKTIAENIFLLNRLFDANETAAPKQSKIIALKQYEPIVLESIKIPASIPVTAEAKGEWNIAKEVKSGSIKTGVIPFIFIESLSV